ncbi:MAG: hypothetical protein AAFR59_04235, partial [Bacteroidota bacterium]
DYDQENTLLSFLQGVLTGKTDAKVSVSGHSLGGALTQVYANYLRSELSSDIEVEAWVYAGPTAGNKMFAEKLVTNLKAENYHAYNNRLDVVPHVWQADSLSKICSIYDKLELCHWRIGEHPIISMVSQYLMQIASTSATNKYTIPGEPQTFEVDAPNSLVDCVDIFAGIAAAWNSGEIDAANLKKATAPFVGKCGITAATQEAQAFQAMLYLAELGEQHTTAYTEYFFQDPALRAAVHKYANSYESKTQEASNADEGLIILTTFFQNVVKGIGDDPNCDCS